MKERKQKDRRESPCLLCLECSCSDAYNKKERGPFTGSRSSKGISDYSVDYSTLPMTSLRMLPPPVPVTVTFVAVQPDTCVDIAAPTN